MSWGGSTWRSTGPSRALPPRPWIAVDSARGQRRPRGRCPTRAARPRLGRCTRCPEGAYADVSILPLRAHCLRLRLHERRRAYLARGCSPISRIPAQWRHPPACGSRRRSGPRRAAARRGAGDRGGCVPDSGRRTPTATTRWRINAMRSETQRGPRRPVDDPPLRAEEARGSIPRGQQLINPATPSGRSSYAGVGDESQALLWRPPQQQIRRQERRWFAPPIHHCGNHWPDRHE